MTSRTMTSTMRLMLLLALLMVKGNGSLSDVDSSHRDYVGVVADEVMTQSYLISRHETTIL